MDLNLTTEELSFRDELRAWLVSKSRRTGTSGVKAH